MKSSNNLSITKTINKYGSVELEKSQVSPDSKHTVEVGSKTTSRATSNHDISSCAHSSSNERLNNGIESTATTEVQLEATRSAGDQVVIAACERTVWVP
jgi:hypothetical protein